LGTPPEMKVGLNKYHSVSRQAIKLARSTSPRAIEAETGDQR